VQSALFSGLNRALFSVSPLRLQIEADSGNKDAGQVLELRKSANQILATIIWGNVSTYVLLTLSSDPVLAGFAAFVFSAFAITLLGEMFPQAYFSRNALAMTFGKKAKRGGSARTVIRPSGRQITLVTRAWSRPE